MSDILKTGLPYKNNILILITNLLIICIYFSFTETSAIFAQGNEEDKNTDTVYIEEMVVTADRLRNYVENHPEAIEALNIDEMEKKGYQSLGETLNTVSGVDVKEYSGSLGARILIRGNSDVKVLLDGRPLNSSQTGSVDLNIIPFTSIKKVEIFKPPVPVWLGSGGSGGVINIVTKGFVKKKADKNKHQAKVGGGSYGLVHGNYAYNASIDEKNQLRVAITGKHLDGKRANSDNTSANADFKWQRESKSNNSTSVNYNIYLKEKGAPGPVDNKTPDAEQRYFRTSLDIGHKGLINNYYSFTAKLFGDYEHLHDKSQSGFVSKLDVYQAGLKTKVEWSPSNDGGWMAGIDLSRNGSDHTLTGRHNRNIISSFLQSDRYLGPITGTLGIRTDYYSDYKVYCNPKLGISYGLNDRTVMRFNTGYKVVCPAFSQLYQSAHGSIDQVRGNQDLDPQRFWQNSLSVEYKWGKGHSIESTIFKDQIHDYITYARGNDLIYSPVNVDRAYRQGIEANWQIKWCPFIETQLSYTYLDTENKKYDTSLPYNPRHKIKLMIINLMPKGMRLETTLRYSSKTYTDLMNYSDMVIDPYTTMDLRFVKTFEKIKGHFYLIIKNVWNESFDVHHGYPDNGTTFDTGIKIIF